MIKSHTLLVFVTDIVGKEDKYAYNATSVQYSWQTKQQRPTYFFVFILVFVFYLYLYMLPENLEQVP